MADEIQNLPALPVAAIRRVDAPDPDARSNADGHLSDRPDPRGRKPPENKKNIPPPPPAPEPAAPATLLHDEAALTHAARALQGRARPVPPPPLPAESPEEPPATPPPPPPAPAEHIRITA
jgi:hypothetical protein